MSSELMTQERHELLKQAKELGWPDNRGTKPELIAFIEGQGGAGDYESGNLQAEDTAGGLQPAAGGVAVMEPPPIRVPHSARDENRRFPINQHSPTGVSNMLIPTADYQVKVLGGGGKGQAPDITDTIKNVPGPTAAIREFRIKYGLGSKWRYSAYLIPGTEREGTQEGYSAAHTQADES